MIKIIFVPHKLNYHYTYNTTNSIYLAICFLLLSSPLPKFTTAQYDDPSSDATRGIRSNWNASPPPHPLTGVIFIAFTGVIILVMILYYYFREGCLQRSVEISRGAAAGIRFSLRNPSQQGRRGLDPDVIKSFPVFHYSEVKDLKEVMKKGPLECAVCLSAFEDDETLRLLPKCDHVFHPQCVDVWLESHTTCPYCRADLVPDDNKSNHVSVIVAEYETNTAGGSFDCSCSRSRGGATSGSDDVTLQVEDDGGGGGAAAVVGRSSTAIPTGDEDAAATTVKNGSAATDQANNNYNNRSIIDQCRTLGSFGKLSRWNSTGHVDSERFTLRLPTEFESQLGSSRGKHRQTIQDQEVVSLHRTRSCTVLPSTCEYTNGPVGQYSGGGFCSDLIWVKTYIDQEKGTGV